MQLTDQLLQVHLLGQLRVAVDGEPFAFVAVRKTLPLFGYLLLHRDRPTAREFLAFTLWPDDDEDDARTKLRSNLHFLTKALPNPQPDVPWILADGSSVQWNPQAKLWLDVAAFEHLSRDPATLDDAVALYKGDVLEPVYDDWLFAERERLRGIYLADLGDLILAHRSRRDFARAAAYAQRLLAADPWREDVLRQLMAIRYEAADRAGSLAEHQRFVRRLRDEVGIEPMPETEALRDAIAHNKPLPSAPQPPEAKQAKTQTKQLPFVGRGLEMAQLEAWWSRAARGRGTLVLVGGEAGIGKTRLAAELALMVEAQGGRALYGSTSDPENNPYQPLVEALRSALPLLAALEVEPLWASLVARVMPELRDRLPALGAVPRVEPEREQLRLFEAFTTYLKGLAMPRPLAVILEDLQWAGEATVAGLKFIAQHIAELPILIVATYREEDAPRDHPLRRLRRELRDEKLVNHLSPRRLHVEDVAALVDALPELEHRDGDLAPRLQTQSEGNPLFLTELVRALIEAPEPGAALPAGVRQAIAARIARLTPLARSVAQAAAVVGPDFDVEVVCESGGWEEHAVLDAIAELSDRHLVADAAGRARSDFVFTHHLIHSAVYEGLDEDVRVRRHRRIGQILEQIHRDRVVEMAGELARHFDLGGDPTRAAAHYLVAAQRALELFANDEAIRHASRALEMVSAPRARFELLLVRETARDRRGERAAQHQDLELLAQAAATLDDDDAVCEELRRRIGFHRFLGEREAEAVAIQALHERAEASGSMRWKAAAAHARAVYCELVGRYQSALENLAVALPLYTACGDVEGQVDCYCQQAINLSRDRKLDEALAVLEPARALADSASDPLLLRRTLFAQKTAIFLKGDYRRAIALDQERLQLCRRIGDLRGEANACISIVDAAHELFELETVLEYNKRAATIFTSVGDRRGLASTDIGFAKVSELVGEYDEALQALARADAIYAAADDPRGRSLCQGEKTNVLFLRGDLVGARASGQAALASTRTFEGREFEAWDLGDLGRVESELGELTEAIEHLEAAVRLWSESGGGGGLGEHLARLTISYVRAKRPQEAARSATRLLAHLDSSPEQVASPAFCIWAAAVARRAAGDTAETERLLQRAHTALQEKAAAISVPRFRAAYLALPGNRRLIAAFENGIWP